MGYLINFELKNYSSNLKFPFPIRRIIDYLHIKSLLFVNFLTKKTLEIYLLFKKEVTQGKKHI